MPIAPVSRLRTSDNRYLQGTIFIGNLIVRAVRHLQTQRKVRGAIGAKIWDLRQFKTSDTLFILGSGASICSFGDRQFAEICSNDSVGFNFWLLHEHVPTYYVAEFIADSHRSDFLWRNLYLRSDDYAETPVIVKFSPAFWAQRQRLPRNIFNLFVASHLSIPGEDAGSLSRWMRFLDNLGLLTGGLPGGLILFRQASLSWLLIFALQLHYKKIVFCGVDLNSPHYFYEKDQKYCRENGLEIPPPEFSAPIHPTNDPAQCAQGLTISEVLRVMDEVLMKKRGVELYVGSVESALYPQFPLYNWPTTRQGD